MFDLTHNHHDESDFYNYYLSIGQQKLNWQINLEKKILLKENLKVPIVGIRKKHCH
jgi:hypothetical protein